MARARGDCGSNAFELGMAEVLHPCLLSSPYFFLRLLRRTGQRIEAVFQVQLYHPKQADDQICDHSVCFVPFAFFQCLECGLTEAFPYTRRMESRNRVDQSGDLIAAADGSDSPRKWSITSATVMKRFTPPNLPSTPSRLRRSRTEERASTAWNWIPWA